MRKGAAGRRWPRPTGASRAPIRIGITAKQFQMAKKSSLTDSGRGVGCAIKRAMRSLSDVDPSSPGANKKAYPIREAQTAAAT